MSARDYYKVAGTEPSMRDELNNFLDGRYPEVSKKQTSVLRRMRRDADGALVPCPCVDELTHEPDLDTFCAFCWGEGFYWDEVFIDAYHVIIKSDVGNAVKERLIEPGLINEPLVIFYTRSSVVLSKEDKVIELVLDVEGAPVRPYRRHKLYRIGTPIDLRSDRGRLEFWKLDCYAEKRKFLNGPGGC